MPRLHAHDYALRGLPSHDYALRGLHSHDDALHHALYFHAEAKERAGAEYRRKVESAIQDIENQKQAALVALKNQSGQMAVEIAEKLLRRELGNKSEQEAYAKSLAESINLN